MRAVSQLMDLSGRKALVTGGGGHIGVAVSETLVELGASVAVVDLDESEREKCAEGLSRFRPGCAIGVPCDLSNEQATRAAVRNLIVRYGGLDIVATAQDLWEPRRCLAGPFLLNSRPWEPGRLPCG